ncbi:MAG TPA: hypothetical protein VGY31_15710 [Terriglobia bacterium]|nr:hypothetical protein [Terriglobia bacterium]
MPQTRLLHLARELERLSSEECFFYQQTPASGLQQFLNTQRELLTTADKLQRELAGEISYNPARLMDMEYPFDEELETISGLMAGVEEIKHSAVDSIDELPAKTELLSRSLRGHLTVVSSVA